MAGQEAPPPQLAGIRVARIAGLPITVEWPTLVLSGVIAGSVGTGILTPADPGRPLWEYVAVSVLVTVLFFVCLLAHELGHAIVSRRRGLEVLGISLWLLGGVSRLRGDPPSPRDERDIAVVGPLISVLLGIAVIAVAVGLAAAATPGVITAGVSWLGAANLMLGIFNLVPAFPLDGGRVLRAALWRRSGDRLAATRRAAAVGTTVGSGIIVIGIFEALFADMVGGLWLAIIGWFLESAARTESAGVVEEALLRGVSVGDAMSAEPELVPDWITVSALIHDYILMRHHSAYPTRDFEGRVDGLVSLQNIRGLAPERRSSTRVGDIAEPLATIVQGRSDEPLEALVQRMSERLQTRALIMDGPRLVGILTAADIALALQRAQLVAGDRPRAA